MATFDKYFKARTGVTTPDVLTSSATVYHYFTTPFVAFNTSANIFNPYPGQFYWNSEEGTLDLGMNNDVIQSMGMEFYLPPTKNDSGELIPPGAFVMATGAQGDRITIAKAITDGSVDPMFMVGVAAHSIVDGSEDGLITTNGLVKDINTASFTIGTVLYPDPNLAGGWTDTKPSAPAIRTPVAIVVRQHENTGRIYVRMSNASVLGGTDTNVQFTTLSDNDILTYSQSSSYWTNQNLASAIQEVDGTGSGIDADLLDGEHGSYYAPIDSPTFTGNVNVPEPTSASNAATKKYVDDVVSSGGTVVSSASAYPTSAADHTLFFNTTSGRMAIRVASVWKEFAFVSDEPIGGGDSSTLVFAGSIDGGDSSTTSFVNNYDGGNS